MGTGTGIGRVRGLGSAKSGSHHWIISRVTAVGNLLLMLWFGFSLLAMPSLDFGTLTTWLSSPFTAVPMMLLVISVFYHIRLGMQVMIEDYIQNHATKIGLILLLNFYCLGAGALCIFSLAKIAFAGAA